jgi:hypothetical protein
MLVLLTATVIFFVGPTLAGSPVSFIFNIRINLVHNSGTVLFHAA